MITPEAMRLIINHFDAIDEVVSGRLLRKRPWLEPSLTSLLCDLLDEDCQLEEKIRYSLTDLNKDLAEHDGLFHVKLTIDTHEYDPWMERWITQSDIGLVIEYIDHLMPKNSHKTSTLLQAKRLHPTRKVPLTYCERSRFGSHDKAQQGRMQLLEKVVGVPFVKYLLYCPRPNLLDKATQVKLAYVRNHSLASHIFDYAYGLELYRQLQSIASPLGAGIFVAESNENPQNLGDIHSRIMEAFVPFSWFILWNLGATPNRLKEHTTGDVRDSQTAWADGIVAGDKKAVQRLLDALNVEPCGNDANKSESKSFPVLPVHTITVRISVGESLDTESRRLQLD